MSRDNLQGAAFMVFSMLTFAVEDAFIKSLAGRLSIGQILMLLGAGGAFAFAGLCQAQGHPLFARNMLSRDVLLRNLGELIGTLGFVSAIVLIPLATASAIIQAIPLVVTLGAAVFLAEQVGWRRWLAVIAGLFGVLLILRPGFAAFDWRTLFAVQGVLGLALRDLVTRRMSSDLSSLQLSFLAFLTLTPAGAAIMITFGTAWQPPLAQDWAVLAGAVLFGAVGYYSIVAAMRLGDVGFVSPFRYTRLVFALIIALVVFGERPDAAMLVGAAIIIASGLYTLWRESRKHPRDQSSSGF